MLLVVTKYFIGGAPFFTLFEIHTIEITLSDPAFDKIIKNYLLFLDNAKLPANSGWIMLTEEYYQIWDKKEMQGWTDHYEEYLKERSKMIIKLKIPKNMPGKESIKLRRKYNKDLSKKIKTLPADSQDYYKREFEPFISESPVYIDYFKNKSLEDLKVLCTDFITNQYLLDLHVQMIKIQNEVESTSKEAYVKKYSRLPIVKTILLSIYNSISLLVFGRSLYVLLEEAQNGNKKSFFKMLQIDRTIVECEWAKKMIRKAQLTADEDFFKDMAKAITTPPLENDKEYSLAIIVLLLFWSLGLRKLENEERIELLEECGIRLQDNPETFRTFVSRLISADLKKDIVTLQ